MTPPFTTHEVTNQSPPFADVDLLGTNAALTEAVAREGGGGVDGEALAAFARACGSAEMLELGRLANLHAPRLETHDAKGYRKDFVDYHPAYHALMQASVAAGVAGSTWDHLAGPAGTAPAPGRNVARSARLYLAAQTEAGHCCPLTMTHASVPALMAEPELAEAWLPRILSRKYDRRFLPAPAKTSATIGMGMTEKQGGTDVRANTTRAEATDRASSEHVLTGHKWFLSAPMSDAFLMLAQAEGGPTCFLVPRFLPDGTANGLRLQRLKDKLGNRSNASAEVELARAHAWRVGGPGRGVATIIEMVTLTRLDCAVSSAGLMRLALANAVHHARHRSVFGLRLVEQPLMAEVLADMALDVEAATALVFRLARAFDRADDPRARAFARLMTPVVKYWVCKLAPPLVAEAMECLGGNGYVEDGVAARLYREVPVNSIWEGSGNVMALDVLRVLQREPEAVASVLDDLGEVARLDPHLKAGLERVEAILHEPRFLDRRARQLVETLAVVTAGVVLRGHAPAAIADAFIISRLSGLPRTTYGQGIDWADATAIVARALPA
ncbi:MAG: isovaleryl-CoA dehydrogenase [Hyphomicrobiaceae bacterium]|nr:isovaleryl-CoA dehydrogenase [Hyphomicrobiaceae bacterium]